MRTFQLHILAADRVFFEGECESVVAPTASGQYGVQAHHSNMIAAIAPGQLTFRTAQGETRYAAVSAGMIKVEHNDVLILVDSAERPEDIDVAELRDAFLILEIVESEEVGFFKRGEGHIAARNGETRIGGKMPINPSGGLKAKGHPLGATGVSQVVELVRQLRGEADGRQVEGAKTGLAVNFGGFGNNVVATIVTTD